MCFEQFFSLSPSEVYDYDNGAGPGHNGDARRGMCPVKVNLHMEKKNKEAYRNMSFLGIICITVVAAFIVAALFTMNSNYLDPNINTSLNIPNKLRLRGQFTPEDIKANNLILRNCLNVFTKIGLILSEMDDRKKVFERVDGKTSSGPEKEVEGAR